MSLIEAFARGGFGGLILGLIVSFIMAMVAMPFFDTYPIWLGYVSLGITAALVIILGFVCVQAERRERKERSRESQIQEATN